MQGHILNNNATAEEPIFEAYDHVKTNDASLFSTTCNKALLQCLQVLKPNKKNKKRINLSLLQSFKQERYQFEHQSFTCLHFGKTLCNLVKLFFFKTVVMTLHALQSTA